MWATWAGLLLSPFAPVASPYRSWIGSGIAVPELPLPWPRSVLQKANRVVEARFRAGSTLSSELSRSGIEPDVAAEVLKAAARNIDLLRIRPGQNYALYLDDLDELLALEYTVDRQTSYFVAYDDGAWQAVEVVEPLKSRPVFMSATIFGSLEASLAAVTRSRASTYEIALKIADLYAWDVDFNTDLQPGDRIDLVVEENSVGDDFVGYGDLLAAEFRVRQRVLPAVRYTDFDAKRGYFAPDGQSLHKTFLRSPVKYSRISSRFSHRRVHPVLKVARAHRGVDYVAPPGAPVQATGDGFVQTASTGREQGHYVQIRHGGSYTSSYLHLSRIANGIQRGNEVRQGDVIGYVGKTGNATGYHLHYSLTQGDRYVDPMRVQFPTAAPLSTDQWGAFASQRDRWLSMLRSGQVRPTLHLAGGL